MALWTVRPCSALAPGAILAPERYDPRREALVRKQGARPLGEVVHSVCELVSPRGSPEKDPRRYLIIDTSHSRDGILYSRLPPVGSEALGSAKKVARPGDVLISRLRPYLRQIAYVDAGVPGLSDHVRIACSTEYFVLRPTDKTSIAFLVPFFLSATVQRILAAAQEGGHHPRVGLETILNLPLPPALVAERNELGRKVEAAVRSYRQAEHVLHQLTETASADLACYL